MCHQEHPIYFPRDQAAAQEPHSIATLPPSGASPCVLSQSKADLPISPQHKAKHRQTHGGGGDCAQLLPITLGIEVTAKDRQQRWAMNASSPFEIKLPIACVDE